MRFFSMSILALVFIINMSVSAGAEYVFKKDGSIIKCRILRDENLFLTVKNNAGAKERISRNDILRVLYTELNMGRIYVQKRNGESLKAFIVDEDRVTYTFRTELDKPQEFKINRSDILFIAERNPSGLRGNTGYNDVKLEWYPPIDKMKNFNIYVKKNKGDKYNLAGIAKENLFLLKGLSGNTKYFIIVTGVDDSGTETTPSNELQISTMNTAPRPPAGVKVTPSDNGIAINWDAAEDSDGKVVKYRVYTVIDGQKVQAGETDKLSIKINKASQTGRIMVSSVDDAGAESSSESMRGSQVDSVRIYISPMIIYPAGDFSEMGGNGYGGMIAFMKYNILFSGVAAGIETGYFYLKGENSLEEDGQDVHRFNIIPVLVRAGYKLDLTENLSVTPAVSIGYSYIDLSCTSRDKETSDDTEKSSKGFDLTAAGCVSIDYNVSDYFFIGLNAGYGILIEKNNKFQFAMCGINSGVRF